MTTATVDRRRDAREAARRAREMAAKLERAAGIVSDAERKKTVRFAARDLSLPLVANVERRRACLADPYLFMRTYFPLRFFYDFQPTHHAMIDSIVRAAKQGGSQSIAGPRGDGKTTCATWAGFWEALRGTVPFVGVVSKNGKQAFDVLDEIRDGIMVSDVFAGDFPEIGWVLQHLVTPKSLSVWGLNPRVIWTADTIVLPTLPTAFLRDHGWNQDVESCATGSVFSARGWRGGLRGWKVRGKRPGLVIGDDCDSLESASSETQTSALRHVFERDIAGLGDSRRGAACVYLGTLINPLCFAAYSTDKARRNWHGMRIPLITRFPNRTDLWQQYVDLRKCAAEDDPLARVAFAFYRQHRDQMDAGVETTNPHRYKTELMPDGLPIELSTIQGYYNWVADWGEDSALTELQNDPPESAGPVADGLTPHRIQHQVSGFDRGVIPPQCVLLTMGIDVGKYRLHWVVGAWRQDGTSCLIDYGTQDVIGTSRGTEEGMEQAILSAIRLLASEKHEKPYTKPDGAPLPIAMTLIDSGWGITQTAVYAACRDVGQMVVMPAGDFEPDVQPAKGRGDGAKEEGGRKAGPYGNFQKRDWDLKPGDNWCRSRQRKDRINLYLHNAGHWKDWGIQRWLTATDKPGCRFIWGLPGEQSRQLAVTHGKLSYQLCANCYRDEEVHGHTQRVWGERPGMDGNADHWQDAQELADVAANVMGIRLDGINAPPRPVPNPPNWMQTQEPKRNPARAEPAKTKDPEPPAVAMPTTPSHSPVKGGWFAAQEGRRK